MNCSSHLLLRMTFSLVKQKQEQKQEHKDLKERPVNSGVGSHPPWTWGRVLPRLSVMELVEEFAYRFEGRMLRNCPSSRVLNDNI
jgi:hypothetical protein